MCCPHQERKRFPQMLLTKIPIKILQKDNENMVEGSKKTMQVTGSKSRHVVKATKSNAKNLKEEIIQYFDSNGYLSWSAKKRKYQILGTNAPKDGLVQCPECKIGQLIVIRSPATKKRFVGCSNYHNGCKASSPLLQKAMLKVTKSTCKHCLWPIVVFRYSRKQSWTKQCCNIQCKQKV